MTNEWRQLEIRRLREDLRIEQIFGRNQQAEIKRLRAALESLYQTYLPKQPSETDIRMARAIVAAALDQPDP